MVTKRKPTKRPTKRPAGKRATSTKRPAGKRAAKTVRSSTGRFNGSKSVAPKPPGPLLRLAHAFAMFHARRRHGQNATVELAWNQPERRHR